MVVAAPAPARLAGLAEAAANWAGRHWLALLNLGAVAILGGAILSPLLMAAGATWPGRALFVAYRAICHQLPERSYRVLDYQMAFCHRNTAIFAAIVAGGLAFALVRDRLPPLGWRGFGLLALPMAIDGFSHFLGLRPPEGWLPALALIYPREPLFWSDAVGSLNFWLRTATGIVFGLGAVIFAYPRLEMAHLGRQVALEKVEPDGPGDGRRGGAG